VIYIRHLLFIFISTSTIVAFYFLLNFFTNSSIFVLLIFTFLGVIGFIAQKKLYDFLILEFKFIYLGKEIHLPKIFKKVRDTGMDLAFIMILASVGVNPILDIIEAKKPSFSINFFYFELAITSIIIALLPSILFCYYYMWKNPNYTPKKEQLK